MIYIFIATISPFPFPSSFILPSYLPVGVFGLQSLGLYDVNTDQALLHAVGRKLSELIARASGGGVVWQGVDLEHPLMKRVRRVIESKWTRLRWTGEHI